MQEQPATTLTSGTVHEGRVFTVVRDLVQLPNGRQTTMDVIRHPASRTRARLKICYSICIPKHDLLHELHQLGQ